MYDSFRNGTFALGLTLGIFLTILVCFYIPILSGNDDNSKPQFSHSQIEKKNQGEIRRHETTVSQFNPWEEGYAQWVMALFTVGMTILTAIALYYIRKTTIFTSEALEEAGKTTKAANETINETRRIGEAQTRAYMSMGDIELNFQKVGKSSNDNALITLKWKNTGQSPAHNMGIATWGHVEQFGDKDLPITKFIEKFASLHHGSGDCGTGSHILTDRIVFDGETVQNWKDEKVKLLIYSAICFDDIFGKTHKVESCSVMVTQVGSNGDIVTRFRGHRYHNKQIYST